MHEKFRLSLAGLAESTESAESANSAGQLYLGIWAKDGNKRFTALSDNPGNAGRRMINETTLTLTLLSPNVDDTGLYTCKTKFPVQRLDDGKDMGRVMIEILYNLTINTMLSTENVI